MSKILVIIFLILFAVYLPVHSFGASIRTYTAADAIGTATFIEASSRNVLPAETAENKCVPSDVIIKTLEYAVSQMHDNPSVGVIAYTAECDPCKCPVNGMADCYAFMEKRERERMAKHKNIHDILDRAKKYGVCK